MHAKFNEIVRVRFSSNRTGVLIKRKRNMRSVHRRKGHVEVLGETGHLQAREKELHRNQLSWHLELRLLVSRTVRKYISVV